MQFPTNSRIRLKFQPKRRTLKRIIRLLNSTAVAVFVVGQTGTDEGTLNSRVQWARGVGRQSYDGTSLLVGRIWTRRAHTGTPPVSSPLSIRTRRSPVACWTDLWASTDRPPYQGNTGWSLLSMYPTTSWAFDKWGYEVICLISVGRQAFLFRGETK